MKLNGHITILFSDEGMIVEIEDVNSGITIVKATLNQKQTCQVMSRLSCTDCELEILGNLENVGKKLEVDKLEFPLGVNSSMGVDLKEIANQKVKEYCPEGWTPLTYYGSRDSFFLKEKDLIGRKLLFSVGYKSFDILESKKGKMTKRLKDSTLSH